MNNELEDIVTADEWDQDFPDMRGDEPWYDDEPGDLGFDPYAGTYLDDEPFGSDLYGEW